MNILVTGAKGFLGKNLIARINAMETGTVLPFDIDDTLDKLKEYILKADFIFHLAGINRPKEQFEYYEGNAELTETIVKIIEEKSNKIPIAFSSTMQVGNGSDYAKSKEMAEKTLIEYAARTDAKVFIYRFPGIFGKWSKPDYNTVVATYCHNIAHGLPIDIRDPDYTLTLCYVDDVVDVLLQTMNQQETLEIEPLYQITLGELASQINTFASEDFKLGISDFSDIFTKKLYATYLSFLPENNITYPLTMHKDERGSFTEFLHLPRHGQVSVNVTKPGITKGNHWHDTKCEKFLVVSGHGVVKLRKLNSADVLEYNVSDDNLEVVNIPPGYTHNFTNLGDKDMVTLIWVNEVFDKLHPDTFFEKVDE
ncbi:MAG: NAD-dependent epimerase/dehydratase family protein [Oscillospiraceae bacterium]|nr:NAD-dependent epimerase/dehydratase family protein [Oscillospiraceae bacterium]